MGRRNHFMLAWLMLLPACKQTIERPDDGPLTFDVQVVSGELGAVDSPIPYAGDMQFVLDIAAVDREGQLARDFSGDVHLDVQPRGALTPEQPEWITIRDGMALGVPVAVTGVHGPSAIWVENTGQDDDPGNYATGLTPTIYVQNPTIHQIQATDKFRTSALEGDFVEVNLEGRTAVVTGVTQDGFFITDISEETDTFNAIYAFSFSRPKDIEMGTRLTQLSGTVEEFFGFTELGFPSWRIDGATALPSPVELDLATIAVDTDMEQYESRIVMVTNVTVCPPGEDFFTFGQWIVLLDPQGDCNSGDGGITVVSAFTVDWFDPLDHSGNTVSMVRGNLRYHQSAQPAWMIYPRFDDDIAM